MHRSLLVAALLALTARADVPAAQFALPGAQILHDDEDLGVANGRLTCGVSKEYLGRINGVWSPPWVSSDFTLHWTLNGEEPRFAFDVDFQVESYLQHQGESFLKRFDANTYLYMTRVMDYFDAFADPAAAQAALAAGDTRFLVISFDSDWRFDTEHSREIVRHLQAGRVPVTFREIESPWGHDSFLLEMPEYDRSVAAFLDRAATDMGVR